MAVVCTRSDYFEKAFQTGMKEGQAKSIEITDDDQHYVEALVKYLYILGTDDPFRRRVPTLTI